MTTSLSASRTRQDWVLTQTDAVTASAFAHTDLDPAQLPDHMERQLIEAINNIAMWVNEEMARP